MSEVKIPTHQDLGSGAVAGPRIEWSTEVNGMKLRVVLKNINADPNLFMVSIECPFFNVYREIVNKKGVIEELDKVSKFLKSDGGGA